MLQWLHYSTLFPLKLQWSWQSLSPSIPQELTRSQTNSWSSTQGHIGTHKWLSSGDLWLSQLGTYQRNWNPTDVKPWESHCKAGSMFPFPVLHLAWHPAAVRLRCWRELMAGSSFWTHNHRVIEHIWWHSSNPLFHTWGTGQWRNVSKAIRIFCATSAL